ncbi:MAG: helix-turn-helix transcriptional regulator [Clostridia bacterium]|nr:helix-turn-helix transcriptional regulator [Clostridia bacterium]
MIVLSLLHALEGYTHDNWVYKDINVNFSRLYYVIDGEAYYEENGKTTRLKKGHLYLTPIKKTFTLYDNPSNKMLHTFSHIITMPAVSAFTEIEVKPNTPLFDAVCLYRKYINADQQVLTPVIQFVLSCLNLSNTEKNPIATKIKQRIDDFATFDTNMSTLCKDLGYSREYLTRAFTEEFRMTPKQYLFLRKINEGLRLLCEGKSVTETSDILCYSSPFAFSKAFKQHFGLSPENYLKTIQPLQNVCP